MPKLKPQEIEQRRREIVEAARACFIRSGFHQTTTDEICHEAAITPGGLYHYFPSKEEIIKAVVEEANQRTLQVMESTAAQSPDPRSALRSVGAFFFRSVYEPDFDNVARLDLETWNESLLNQELARILEEGRAATQKALAAVIQEAIDRGEYNPKVDPRGLANLFVAIYTGLRVGKLLTPGHVDVDSAFAALRVLIRGELLTAAARALPDGLPLGQVQATSQQRPAATA